MKKITLIFSAFLISSGILISNAQTTFTDTFNVDLSTLQSWDAEGDPDNVFFTVLLDGLASTSPCDNPVLEWTGVAWDVVQQTIGASWLNQI